MSAGWVAASVRARAMGHRRVGLEGARALATAQRYPDAVEAVVRSPYGERVSAGADLATAGRGVAATVLWNLRVLAGWVPPAGPDVLRVVAGWFEIANIEQHVRALAGQPAEPPFALGALSTAWPRLARSGSVDELCATLASSPWGPVSGSTPYDIELSLRLSWARRALARVPAARAWTLSATALLLARERFARERSVGATALSKAVLDAFGRVVGIPAANATTPDELRESLPHGAQWVLDTGVDELWRAEAAWWRRLRDDSARLVAAAGFGPDHVLGAAGLLAADAHLVVGALGLAGRGPQAGKVFDELA